MNAPTVYYLLVCVNAYLNVIYQPDISTFHHVGYWL